MKTHTFETDEIDTWYRYFEELPQRGPYHDPMYISLLEGYFEFDEEQAELFVLEDNGDFVYYPYFKRPLTTLSFSASEIDQDEVFDIVSSWYYGGPLLSDQDRGALAEAFADAFSSYCEKAGIVAEFVRFDPNIRNDQRFEVLEPEHNRQTVPVDLTKTLDTIWKEYSSSNRTHIRQAREAGFDVEQATTSEEVIAFNSIYTAAMDAKDASPHYRFPLSFFETLVLDHPELVTLLVSTYEDDIVGGSFIVHTRGMANEYLRASEPDLWDLGLNNHLCHNAIVEMHERGLDLVDFQGGRPGVFRFKKAFSPERGEFHLARQVHDESTYEALVNAAAKSGIDTESGYFPAYRVKQSN